MPKFRVWCGETILFRAVIEAPDADTAMKIARYSGGVNWEQVKTQRLDHYCPVNLDAEKGQDNEQE